MLNGTNCVGGGNKKPLFTPKPKLKANWFSYPLKKGFVFNNVGNVHLKNVSMEGQIGEVYEGFGNEVITVD